MWYIYTIEHYTAVRKNKILLFATWMDQEGILFSEINQTEKYRYYVISFVLESKEQMKQTK